MTIYSPAHNSSQNNPNILLLSTSDTDLITAYVSEVRFKWANPSRLTNSELKKLLFGIEIVVIRILGGYHLWQKYIHTVKNSGLPTIIVSGEQSPDAELMMHSTVPQSITLKTHIYLAQGGITNLTNLYYFLSDSILKTKFGFHIPIMIPSWGLINLTETSAYNQCYQKDDRLTIAVLYYRAHQLAGNIDYIKAICFAIEKAGAQALPIFCTSLRSIEPKLIDLLSTTDSIIATVLASGSITTNTNADLVDDIWHADQLASLDISILQGLCLTSSKNYWLSNNDGISPLDVATQVAIPEFDGRIITVPFSFKEIDSKQFISYEVDSERCERVAGIAMRHAKLRTIPNIKKRVAIVISAYPTKHSRIGNAVGLDTLSSAIALLRAMRNVGYNIENSSFNETNLASIINNSDGDALIRLLIKYGGQDPNWSVYESLVNKSNRVLAKDYHAWFITQSIEFINKVIEHWGLPPGNLFVDRSKYFDGEIVISAIQAGNVVIMLQPPRGFGENPVSIYHDPDLSPSHHYLASYRWLDNSFINSFKADALIHLGKHGNLEWLPGKSLGMSRVCSTDIALGELPLIYPFLVNDPGEGTQAKRRAHAIIIDHLIPPMVRAETYGDISKLEQLIDEYSTIAALDPIKLPAIRSQIWKLMNDAKMNQDLGLYKRPDEKSFDDMLLHLDGWLCEIKDVQIRDGLHILGNKPSKEGELNLILAIVRAKQLFADGETIPGLRQALGLIEDNSECRTIIDSTEAEARILIASMQNSNWDIAMADLLKLDVFLFETAISSNISKVLYFIINEIVPRLAGTINEINQIIYALSGKFILPGPSGSPLRGLINVLPTGRNFYSVDPKAVPSKLAWETGNMMADSLLKRYYKEYNQWPDSVGISIWATSTMRTSGDDIAEILALLGVKPVWDSASRRIIKLEPIDLHTLGRPRIDVTVRISGFFRDAFPHIITMIDDAVVMVSNLDEPLEKNYIRAHVQTDLATLNDQRRATIRIFGSKPGTYGAGILQLIDSRNWINNSDFASVYSTWGNFIYGRNLFGKPASEDMNRVYSRISLAVKNIDSQEHDIADSDDYFQYHGGMISVVRKLTGHPPASYISDNTRTDIIRTRTLLEEMSLVFRSRVVNPRWIKAMRSHGYKGASEMEATVDYLFGYDATTNVVADWMYEKLSSEYVLDKENREFMNNSNQWALYNITERLLEAASRKMWAHPKKDTISKLHNILLETENELE